MEEFFLIYNSFSIFFDIQISKQSFISLVNHVNKISHVIPMSELGRRVYFYETEEGGLIPFAYRCLKD